MKINEPKSMAEIHHIREKLSEEWKKQPWNKVSQEMEQKATILAKKMKLPIQSPSITEKV